MYICIHITKPGVVLYVYMRDIIYPSICTYRFIYHIHVHVHIDTYVYIKEKVVICVCVYMCTHINI